MNPRGSPLSMRARILVLLSVAASFASGATPALGRWHLVGASNSSIAYNQGIAYDVARGNFFFDGVSSLMNSGLYRTDSRLRQIAANTTVIPKTTEGYNHAGDLSYDPVGQRILLPLECYYPKAGGNTCATGAIGVVDPVTLRFRYYVNLARSQIAKAMWDEVSPDGRWIWTSSGTHLLAYRATNISRATARSQRAGRKAGIVGVDLGAVLPSRGVTGATFYRDPHTRTMRLFLSLNLGASFEVVSFCTRTADDGQPKLLSSPSSTIIRLARSHLNDEPEGLAITLPSHRRYPLGGLLHWQMLPAITPSTAFTRTFTYLP
jgi:hypothetical protein